ncbi:putative pentatricopeptide repeat-containing protein At3g49142 [Aristolochia californica]|uniref:putative pentatricopeptide repeat-containing protein At3g49142 n=1 Tax=Aristolochia californica TaxID=171875 RepID=UPI0035D5C41B
MIVSNVLLDNTYLRTKLCGMYAVCGNITDARILFDQVVLKSSFLWNIMIRGYACGGYSGDALLLYRQMSTFGRKADKFTYPFVVKACGDLRVEEIGRRVHCEIIVNELQWDVFVGNSLVFMYTRFGDVASARKLFDGMPTRDLTTWNTMISGYVKNGWIKSRCCDVCQCGACLCRFRGVKAGYIRSNDAVESLRLFRRLHLEGYLPDQVTFITALGACGQIAALQVGTCIHAFLIRNRSLKDLILGTALLDMYAKCGYLTLSHKIFYEMPENNLVSWTAMISACGLHGRGKDAITLLGQMKEKGIKPDKVTITSVLSACSHAGLVEEARHIFNQIVKEHSMNPSVEHYACMVDLLGRAGHLDEAFRLLKSMKCKPTADLWVALLSACRVHRNLSLAEIAARHAFALKPEGVGSYVSLSNMYAAEKRWKDVEMVRAILRNRGIKKDPGCSFIEFDRVIYRFLVGDKSHPQSDCIYSKLDELRNLVKGCGYVPDTRCVLYNVEDGVKQKMLWDHSERLAIAFALINTPEGTPVRIIKNLRVCVDCHTVTKLISKLVRRDIIVRDARRFHHFSHGSCSCGDFW